MKIKIEILNKSHYRKDFNCGNEVLNNYLKKQASQDVKKKLAVCFVYVELDDKIEYVKGYFTLSNYGISRALIPENLSNKFPRSYLTIPTTLIGRLARDLNCRQSRVGESLLINALHKAYQSSLKLASYAVVVDAIDDNAINFYEKYGFKLLDSKKLFLPMGTIIKLFEIG